MRHIQIMMLISILTSNASNAQTAIESEEMGFSFFYKKDYLNALMWFNKAVEKDSTSPRYYADRALVYEKMNSLTEAYADIDRALKINPSYPFAYEYKASFLFNEKKFEESINTGKEGLTKIPLGDSIRCSMLNEIGLAYYFLKDYPQSITYLEDAVKECGNMVTYKYNLAGAYNKAGNRKKSIKILEQAIKKDSLRSEPFNNLGMRYLESGQYDKAESFFLRAIKLDSTNAMPFNNYGFCEYKLNKYDEALKSINHSLAIAPKNSYAYKNRALVYLAINKKEEACADLHKADKLGYSIYFDNEVFDLISANCR